jgi:phage/plasmid-like protein (TIGR03299 family)
MASVGKMFYTDETEWHRGQGRCVPPLALDEALHEAGLEWDVDAVHVVSAGSTEQSKAIVRLDRPSDDPGRILSVVPSHFEPIQNRDAGAAVDAVFGNGRRVYHTGGYLGHGETAWLLAKIDKPLRIGGEDLVLPYALMANGHGGEGLTIRLTFVRVVCRNTLAMAMKTSVGPLFRRDNRDGLSCADAARQFFAATMHDLDVWHQSFVDLSRRLCSEGMFQFVLAQLFPDPPPPGMAAKDDPYAFAEWQQQLARSRAARAKIEELRESGDGTWMPAAQGTFWGVLNAVTEYVDHHEPVEGSRLAHALLGRGMEMKVQAFDLIQTLARASRRFGLPAAEELAASSRWSQPRCA